VPSGADVARGPVGPRGEQRRLRTDHLVGCSPGRGRPRGGSRSARSASAVGLFSTHTRTVTNSSVNPQGPRSSTARCPPPAVEPVRRQRGARSVIPN
jgi:hypothetical protein